MIGPAGLKQKGFFPPPLDYITIIIIISSRNGSWCRYGDHAFYLQQLILKAINLLIQGSCTGDHKYLLLIETKLFALHIIQLPEHDDRSYNKYDRYGKLQYHQSATQSAILLTTAKISLQHFVGIERRQIKSRISAGKETNYNTKKQKCRNGIPVFKVAYLQIQVKKVIKIRQCEFGDQYGQ